VAIGETPTGGCKGTVESPEAEAPAEGEPPLLCVFEGKGVLHKEGLSSPTVLGFASGAAGPTGAVLLFKTLKPTTPGEGVSAEGTWALTG